jgi:hypothetical protein
LSTEKPPDEYKNPEKTAIGTKQPPKSSWRKSKSDKQPAAGAT